VGVEDLTHRVPGEIGEGDDAASEVRGVANRRVDELGLPNGPEVDGPSSRYPDMHST
jgi:hypothetical protein